MGGDVEVGLQPNLLTSLSLVLRLDQERLVRIRKEENRAGRMIPGRGSSECKCLKIGKESGEAASGSAWQVPEQQHETEVSIGQLASKWRVQETIKCFQQRRDRFRYSYEKDSL